MGYFRKDVIPLASGLYLVSDERSDIVLVIVQIHSKHHIKKIC